MGTDLYPNTLGCALTVRFDAREIQTMMPAGSILLDAVESTGAPIRSACRKGRCGACRVEVEGGALADTSVFLADGRALACMATIVQDVEIRISRRSDYCKQTPGAKAE